VYGNYADAAEMAKTGSAAGGNHAMTATAVKAFAALGVHAITADQADAEAADCSHAVAANLSVAANCRHAVAAAASFGVAAKSLHTNTSGIFASDEAIAAISYDGGAATPDCPAFGAFGANTNAEVGCAKPPIANCPDGSTAKALDSNTSTE
jgi:hypothetical protein